MSSSDRVSIRLHPVAQEDVEEQRAMIVGQRDHLMDRIATREPRLIDRRRFQELFNYYMYAIEISEYSRVAGSDAATELSLFTRAAEYVSTYLANATSAPDAAAISIDVDDLAVEVVPTELSDSAFRLFEAPFLIVVARDAVALERWRRFDIDGINFPDRVGFTYRRHFLDCFRSFVLDGVLNRTAIDQMTAVADGATGAMAKSKPDYSEFIFMFQPLTEALIALDANDLSGFRTSVYEANARHRAYWDRNQRIDAGSPQVRRDPRGWLSLPATAIAALGHDRGMELDFESDYMPAFMVTGAP